MPGGGGTVSSAARGGDYWDAICDEASLSATDRAFLWGRQFLNPYAFEDLNGDAAHLKALADKARF